MSLKDNLIHQSKWDTAMQKVGEGRETKPSSVMVRTTQQKSRRPSTHYNMQHAAEQQLLPPPLLFCR